MYFANKKWISVYSTMLSMSLKHAWWMDAFSGWLLCMHSMLLLPSIPYTHIWYAPIFFIDILMRVMDVIFSFPHWPHKQNVPANIVSGMVSWAIQFAQRPKKLQMTIIVPAPGIYIRQRYIPNKQNTKANMRAHHKHTSNQHAAFYPFCVMFIRWLSESFSYFTE